MAEEARKLDMNGVIRSSLSSSLSANVWLFLRLPLLCVCFFFLFIFFLNLLLCPRCYFAFIYLFMYRFHLFIHSLYLFIHYYFLSCYLRAILVFPFFSFLFLFSSLALFLIVEGTYDLYRIIIFQFLLIFLFFFMWCPC